MRRRDEKHLQEKQTYEDRLAALEEAKESLLDENSDLLTSRRSEDEDIDAAIRTAAVQAELLHSLIYLQAS